jgi:hypothetical protein
LIGATAGRPDRPASTRPDRPRDLALALSSPSDVPKHAARLTTMRPLWLSDCKRTTLGAISGRRVAWRGSDNDVGAGIDYRRRSTSDWLRPTGDLIGRKREREPENACPLPAARGRRNLVRPSDGVWNPTVLLKMGHATLQGSQLHAQDRRPRMRRRDAWLACSSSHLNAMTLLRRILCKAVVKRADDRRLPRWPK